MNPEISPVPSDEEAAAIAAAIDAAWPRPAVADLPVAATSAWRFSGRWWSVPLPVRRHRPWR